MNLGAPGSDRWRECVVRLVMPREKLEGKVSASSLCDWQDGMRAWSARGLRRNSLNPYPEEALGLGGAPSVVRAMAMWAGRSCWGLLQRRSALQVSKMS